MSPLTKVFVVLLVVFSIAFTMSVISFVVQTSDWRKQANAYRDQQRVVETHMRNLGASHAAEKAAWLDARNELDAKINSLESRNQALTQDLAKYRADLAAVTAEKSSDEALARKLAGELQVAQAGWVEQRKQRDSLDKQTTDLRRRNQDLSDRVDELTTQIQVLVQEKRQFEQQVHMLRTENEKLARIARQPGVLIEEIATGPSMKGVAALTEAAGSPIRGRVVEVNGNLASISVGSADGVEPGMVFVIHRGSDYIGDLEITDVEPHAAAGRITQTRGTPRVGDAVADEARFGLVE